MGSVTSKDSFTPDLYGEKVMGMILNQMLIEGEMVF
ncbi:MAG: hypothetical protein ACI9A7_001010 [Cyclobacteriaceae bacterium]